MSAARVTIDAIRNAENIIDPTFLHSPQLEFAPLSTAVGCNIVLKIETLNPIRCFKGRGADFLLAEARRTGDDRPIVCASAGNFGQAMAYSGARRGVPVSVFAAENASPFKIDRMRQLGANVQLFGTDFDTAKEEARRYAAKAGARMVEDSKDVETVVGAGTIGLEMTRLEGAPLDAIVVPLGNGAMINGVATAIKAISPTTRVIAVQASGAPAMIESWRNNAVIESEFIDTIADGIAVRVPVPEALADMQEVVDDGVLVDDDLTIEAMKLIHWHAGLVAEPSGAIGLAAILGHANQFADKRVATIICGSNLTRNQMRAWL
ncbi:MAG: threonine ammonia-lyase [Hyphomicrobiaceae bacterium]